MAEKRAHNEEMDFWDATENHIGPITEIHKFLLSKINMNEHSSWSGIVAEDFNDICEEVNNFVEHLTAEELEQLTNKGLVKSRFGPTKKLPIAFKSQIRSIHQLALKYSFSEYFENTKAKRPNINLARESAHSSSTLNQSSRYAGAVHTAGLHMENSWNQRLN